MPPLALSEWDVLAGEVRTRPWAFCRRHEAPRGMSSRIIVSLRVQPGVTADYISLMIKGSAYCLLRITWYVMKG